MGRKESVKSRLLRRHTVDPVTNCWIFDGAKDSWGYGLIGTPDGLAKAHRASFSEFIGPIPQGKLILHNCDTPACINPDHLRIGTHKENMRDKVTRNRQSRTHGTKAGKLAKLTEEDVIYIRQDQRPYKIIAEMYGVHPGTIGDIKRRKTWRHI